MSLNRYAAKRDANEPAIRARFGLRGWTTEQISGSGMPDLLAFNPKAFGTHVLLVEVKMPTGSLKPAQVKKWKELWVKGIRVYVARTPEDVDAIVNGTATPWHPEATPGTPKPAVYHRRKT